MARRLCAAQLINVNILIETIQPSTSIVCKSLLAFECVCVWIVFDCWDLRVEMERDNENRMPFKLKQRNLLSNDLLNLSHKVIFEDKSGRIVFPYRLFLLISMYKYISPTTEIRRWVWCVVTSGNDQCINLRRRYASSGGCLSIQTDRCVNCRIETEHGILLVFSFCSGGKRMSHKVDES